MHFLKVFRGSEPLKEGLFDRQRSFFKVLSHLGSNKPQQATSEPLRH